MNANHQLPYTYIPPHLPSSLCLSPSPPCALHLSCCCCCSSCVRWWQLSPLRPCSQLSWLQTDSTLRSGHTSSFSVRARNRAHNFWCSVYAQGSQFGQERERTAAPFFPPPLVRFSLKLQEVPCKFMWLWYSLMECRVSWATSLFHEFTKWLERSLELFLKLLRKIRQSNLLWLHRRHKIICFRRSSRSEMCASDKKERRSLAEWLTFRMFLSKVVQLYQQHF